MTHLDYPNAQRFSDATKQLVAGRPLINVLRMWAHSEPLLPLIAQLGATQFAGLELSPRHRELVVLAVADALEAPYIWNQHVAISQVCGVTAIERDALQMGPEWRSRVTFSQADKAILRFAKAVIAGPKASSFELTAMKRHFSPRVIVEVISVVGYYFTVARMTTTLDIESDESGDRSVLDAGIDLAQSAEDR